MQRRDFFKLLATSTWRVLLRKSGASLAPLDSLAEPLPAPHVKRVLVMFKCHFDAGFIDSQTAVVQKYFTVYFPRAIQVASLMRWSGDQRYVWTTGSWLLY
jgi:hypothetical protein